MSQEEFDENAREVNGKFGEGHSGNRAGRPKGSGNKPKPEMDTTLFTPIITDNVKSSMAQNAVRFINAVWGEIGKGSPRGMRYSEIMLGKLIAEKLDTSEKGVGVDILRDMDPNDIREMAEELE